MLKKLGIVGGIFVFSAAVSGCGKQCREAKEAILTPTQKVAQYLQTEPSGQELANAGCAVILSDFAKLPEGSTTIREIADQRFSHDISRCLSWAQGQRYVCEEYGDYYRRYRSCRWVPYTYCTAWSNEQVQEKGYREAIELATKLDQLFEQAQRMCRLADTGNVVDAEFEARRMREFLEKDVLPQSQNTYRMACGSSASSDEDWGD
jgi:hypothetical protein